MWVRHLSYQIRLKSCHFDERSEENPEGLGEAKSPPTGLCMSS